MLEAHGIQQLAQLAERGPAPTRVVQLGQLLRDGAAALEVVAPRVVHEGAEDALGIHAGVVVEVGVLRREHRLRHVLRQLLEPDGATRCAPETRERRAVRRHDPGGSGEVVEPADVRRERRQRAGIRATANAYGHQKCADA